MYAFIRLRFPIFRRELQAASRRTRTHGLRVLFGGVGALAAAIFLWQAGALGASTTLLGLGLFRVLEALLLVLCIIGGGLSSLNALKVEKRDGLLGLLFLTNLSAREIVLGKLASEIWVLLHALLGFVPILGISVLFGSVSPSDIGIGFLTLLSALVFSASVGVMCSVLTRNERRAALLWTALFSGVSVAPYLVAQGLYNLPMPSPFAWWHVKIISPGFLPQMIYSGNPMTGGYEWFFGIGLLVQTGLSILCLEIASAWLKRHWRDVGAG